MIELDEPVSLCQLENRVEHAMVSHTLRRISEIMLSTGNAERRGNAMTTFVGGRFRYLLGTTHARLAVAPCSMLAWAILIDMNSPTKVKSNEWLIASQTRRYTHSQ